MSRNKPSIAIIIPGGIGTGHNNIGVPVLERIVKLLARDYNITVFSLFKVNESYRQNHFKLISITGSTTIMTIIKFISTFIREQRKTKFVAIHGFWALPSGFLAVLFGKIFKIRSLVSILGGDAISLPEIRYGQLQRWLPRKLIMWTLRNADEVISLTEYLNNNLKKFGLRRDDVKIIPWGIDTDVFKFREKEMGDCIQFLHIGNLSPVKDQDTLLRAFKIIHHQVRCKLTIIGEGILDTQVKALARELNLQDDVLFAGLLPYESLPPFYEQSDILLHTSLSEGQSEVVTEAMSTGVIVCGTSVGLLYDTPECCVSVPVRDFESLGAHVLELIKDPARMKQLRRNAHAWASHHSIYWTANQTGELYI